MSAPVFYLGAHHPNWLSSAGVPLFVSRRSLGKYKKLPRAVAPWALDSGGFTEISMHGEWRSSPAEYVAEVRRFRDDVGQLAFAAPQDWMCEPVMIKRTGLSVEEHQRRSIVNYLDLRSLAPDLPIIPVLQGWSIGSYWRHADDYARAGVDLTALPLVGVGTVCRRQNTTTASIILHGLAAAGIRLHGFGLKLQGLRAAADALASADSMAWSYNARRNPPLPGHAHKNCANCLEWALDWREGALSAATHSAPRQLEFSARVVA
jgi:hypothetical protein